MGEKNVEKKIKADNNVLTRIGMDFCDGGGDDKAKKKRKIDNK